MNTQHQHGLHLPQLNGADVAEILRAIPASPTYADWVQVIFAVAGVLPPDEAATQLAIWSPEDKPGEYSRKIKSAPKRTPGALINIAKKHGFDASAFARRRADGSTMRHAVHKPAARIIAPVSPPPARKSPRYTLRPGTAAELETLATLRGLASAAGLDAMQSAGCLAFADDLNDCDAAGKWFPAKAWFILDPTRRNISARRLDGLPWNCIGGAKSRCVSGEGSKCWPVGITLAAPGQRLDVVEGEGDFVALWHLHARTGCNSGAPVGLLGACANLDAIAPQIASFVVGRTIQIFVHRDENGAGADAAARWAGSFYKLGAASVRARNLAGWLCDGGKDLNDVLRADATRHRTGLCPVCLGHNIIAPTNGPTCTCAAYAWPIFTPAQIAADLNDNE